MRYTGPRGKKVRRLGKAFTEKEARIMDRRQSLPGAHGQSRGKLTEFALQMREKQRAKYAYGLSEKQFYRVYLSAQKEIGKTGENLMRLLERRLDNVVFRMGFASTRPAARQLVGHGFIEVNGKKTDVPSFLTKPGDIITVRESKRGSALVTKLKEDLGTRKPADWVEVKAKDLTGKVLALPTAEQAESIDVRIVVEHFQRI